MRGGELVVEGAHAGVGAGLLRPGKTGVFPVRIKRVVDVGEDLQLGARRPLDAEVLEDPLAEEVVVEVAIDELMEVTIIAAVVDGVLEIGELHAARAEEDAADPPFVDRAGAAPLEGEDQGGARGDREIGEPLLAEQPEEGGEVVGTNDAVVDAGEEPRERETPEEVVELPGEGRRGGGRGSAPLRSDRCGPRGGPRLP